MRRVIHVESLCGLLHDIGKPLLRYALRAEENLEKRDEEVLKMFEGLRDHETIGRTVARELTGIDFEGVCGIFRRALEYADRLAAAERGLSEYAFLGSAWKSVEGRISSSFGLKYGHHYTPMLSPLWILGRLGYLEHTGPCRSGRFSADSSLSGLLDLLGALVDALDGRDIERISASLSRLLTDLKDEPVWFPPQPLTEENLRELRSGSYLEASKGTDYWGVSKRILRGLKLIGGLYSNRISRGYVDTVCELLRYTLATVPAAVYMALLPDTSLYSHSKLVAAYSSVLSLGVDRFKLLVLDARRIQEFVASPVVAKAASRVIRGRSFLAELVSMSLLNYALELYGGLPYTNVVTSEGGTLSLIVPALDSEREKRILDLLEAAVRSTYDRLRGLWFTIVLSREFGLDEVDLVANLKGLRSGLIRGGFLGVLADLERDLAVKKTVDEVASAVYISETEIEGFDVITREPVTKSELEHGYGLRVSTAGAYASAISGGKLEEGDLINEATHMSLAIGSCLRNMSTLISLYAYRRTEDGGLVPSEEHIRGVTDHLRSHVSGLLRRPAHPFELYITGVEFEGHGFSVALVPLETLGALHVMVGSTAATDLADETVRSVVRENLAHAAASATAFLMERVLEKLKGLAEGGVRVRLEVRAVNTGAEFVDLLSHVGLSSALTRAIEDGIDVHVGVVHAGTYHPSSPRVGESGSVGPLALADLDAYNIVALAKADADWLGEVKKLLSFSPTRLSSLSDLLTTVITGKAHLVASRYAEEVARTHGGEPRGPIILYSGGDDVAFYGYWVDVLLFLEKLYADVLGTLRPLSFTSSVALGRGDQPLLDLYAKAARLLEDGKREARGWIFLSDVGSPRLAVCQSGRAVVTAGLRPGHARGPSPTTPLELYPSLARILEALEKSPETKETVAGYKRELRIISQAGSLDASELAALGRALTGLPVDDLGVLYALTRRSVALSYVSARRDRQLEGLSGTLSGILGVDVRLHHRPGEDVFRSLLTSACSKTIIDVLLLYLNPYSTEVRRP